jgi:hypothetical protein
VRRQVTRSTRKLHEGLADVRVAGIQTVRSRSGVWLQTVFRFGLDQKIPNKKRAVRANPARLSLLPSARSFRTGADASTSSP